jgi:hypothetical protein
MDLCITVYTDIIYSHQYILVYTNIYWYIPSHKRVFWYKFVYARTKLSRYANCAWPRDSNPGSHAHCKAVHTIEPGVFMLNNLSTWYQFVRWRIGDALHLPAGVRHPARPPPRPQLSPGHDVACHGLYLDCPDALLHRAGVALFWRGVLKLKQQTVKVQWVEVQWTHTKGVTLYESARLWWPATATGTGTGSACCQCHALYPSHYISKAGST